MSKKIKNYKLTVIDMESNLCGVYFIENATASVTELRPHYYGFLKMFEGFKKPQLTFEVVNDVELRKLKDEQSQHLMNIGKTDL